MIALGKNEDSHQQKIAKKADVFLCAKDQKRQFTALLSFLGQNFYLHYREIVTSTQNFFFSTFLK
jgi:hypothetical protein